MHQTKSASLVVYNIVLAVVAVSLWKILVWNGLKQSHQTNRHGYAQQLQRSFNLNQSEPAIQNDVKQSPSSLFIGEPGQYLLYDFPGGMFPLSTSDFTLNLWYRTPHMPDVRQPIAIFSNVRQMLDHSQYGRHFMLMLQGNGKVSIEFSAGDYVQGTNTHAYNESNDSVDDHQWHQITVIRSHTHASLVLFIDRALQATVPMPTGLDIDSQEQHVVIGGGNDERFRVCFLYELSFWAVYMREPPRDCAPWESESRSFIFHFSFTEENIINNFIVRDTTPTRGNAIWVADGLVNLSDQVPTAMDHPVVSCLQGTSRFVSRDWVADVPVNDTVILSSLPNSCAPGADDLFIKGSFWYIDSYILGIWLDANRLGYYTIIITSPCFPQTIIQKYSTKYVQFLKLEQDLLWRQPPGCDIDIYFQRDAFGGMWVSRWFIELYLIDNTTLLSAFSHIVSLDIRDSRITRRVEWDKINAENADLRGLWLQRNDALVPHKISGGFHGGSKGEVRSLLLEATAMFMSHRCRVDDQNALNNHMETHPGEDLIMLRAKRGFPLINAQQTRIFEGFVFTHGNWWMNKNKGMPLSDLPQIYPQGVPYIKYEE
jgi:hypothetical protein